MNSKTAIGNAVHSRVTEFMDGHVLVSFIGGTNEPDSAKRQPERCCVNSVSG